MLFGESLAPHVVLSVVNILAWIGSMAFAAAALGRRFRVYSIATLVTVIASFGLMFTYVVVLWRTGPHPDPDARRRP